MRGRGQPVFSPLWCSIAVCKTGQVSYFSRLSVCGVREGIPMWWLEIAVWCLPESLSTLFIEIESFYVLPWLA